MSASVASAENEVARPLSNDVFILGAGFSRAVSPLMPLTDELGNACLAVLSEGARVDLPVGFSEGYFEAFLTFSSDGSAIPPGR